MHGVDEGRHLFSSLVWIMQTWWLGTTILTHSNSEYATQADWVTESNCDFNTISNNTKVGKVGPKKQHGDLPV